MSEHYSIIIPTTQHQVHIQDLYYEDIDAKPEIWVGEETQLISEEYQYYIENIGKRFFINGGWILEMSHAIDTGRSFFAGIHIAHILKECQQLQLQDYLAENILWITGEVDCDLNIVAVDGIRQKLEHAYDDLIEKAKQHNIIISVPKENETDVPESIKASLEKAGIEFIFLTKISDITHHLSAKASSHIASFNQPTEYRPYQGLEHYNIEDQKRFFGRSREVKEALDVLEKQPAGQGKLAIVTGASGSGKSSFVRAGLMAHLRQHAALGKEGQKSCICLEMPRNLSLEDLLIFLTPLPDMLETSHHVVLLIDQFEDILSRTQSDQQGNNAFNEFDTQIVKFLENHSNLTLLVTLRSDCYGLLDYIPKIQKYMTAVGGNYPLPSPDETSLKEIIRKPIEQFNVTFEGHLYEDIILQSSSLKDALPLLSVFMNDLWSNAEVKTSDHDQRQIIHLKYSGDVGEGDGTKENMLMHSIANRAEAIFQKLPVNVQDALTEVIFHLTTIEATTLNYHKRSYSYEHFSEDARLLIDRFTQSDARLIVKYQDKHSKDIFVQWAHEAVFRHWKIVLKILESLSQDLQQETQLKPKVQMWKENNQRRDFLIKGHKDNQKARELLKHQEKWLSQDMSLYLRKSYKDHLIKRIALWSASAVFVVTMVFSYHQYDEYKQLDALKKARQYDSEVKGLKNFKQAVHWFRKAAEMGNAEGQVNLGYAYQYSRGIEQDYDKALYWYQKAANQGYPNGQLRMGFAYEEGYLVKQDYKKALYWYRKAYDQGHARSTYRLGLMYENGYGVEKSYKEAVSYYTKSAEKGYADAQQNLGRMYQYGRGVEIDNQKAFEWYKKSADQDNEYGQYRLANCYNNGSCTEQDYEKAAYWYRKAADQGDDDAQNMLGRLYRNGRGLPKDHEKAVYWFRKAAEQDHADAQDSLGRAYKFGEGVIKDEKRAFDLFIEAAEKGNQYAQLNLGNAYDKGMGIKQDYEKAVSWFKKSADQGNHAAQNNLGTMYLHGKGVELDYKKAFYWYMKSAKQGDDIAQNNIADSYYHGRGVEQDYEKAFEWYMKVAENEKSVNCGCGRKRVAYMYEHGEGVPQDHKKAIEWYRSGAEQGNPSAQVAFGLMHSNGRLVPQDGEKAAYWYRKAAEQGDSTGQNNLGWLYEIGRGVEQDHEIAANWYRKAAEQGAAYAQANLANAYEQGKGVPKRVEKAILWYEKAADQGNTYAKKALKKLKRKIK